MRNRRLVWAGLGVLALSLVLAFPLREVLERLVIIPLAYALYALGLFYKAIPQFLWWALAILVVLILVARSLAPGERYTARQSLRAPVTPGPVEELATSIRKAREGIYFKWVVANRLGKLAYSMLVHRTGERSRSVFAPLLGPDWEPSPALRKYLETGLHGSFTDYPAGDRSRSRAASPSAPPATLATLAPLDVEVGQAVEFLESQLEAGRDRHR